MPIRLAIDRLQVIYVILVVAQAVTVTLYYARMMPKSIALVAGFATSVAGPFLSFLVSMHIFRHRRLSKSLDIVSVVLTYFLACLSFAVLYVIIGGRDPHAFNLPPGQSGFELPTALYFSIVTITTTGYGDISPASDFARLIACWEIVTGLLYQVFVFSLVASLIVIPPDRERAP